MSRSEKEHREAERAARRAKRLADRADTRAQRKGDLAKEAQERAERLAERANRKRGPRERALEESFEDFVDDVTDKWSKKAEDWMDEQSGKLFGAEADDLSGGSSAAAEARAARIDAAAARKAAEEAAGYARQSARSGRGAPRYEEDLKTSRNHRSDKESRRARRKRRAGAFSSFSFSKKSSRRKGGTLYRDAENGKFKGVCAGLADYSNMDTWVVRALTIAGVFFFPSVVVPAYFVLYFVLDDKPLYRKVTDKFEEVVEPYIPSEDARTMSNKRKSKKSHNSPEKTVENMRQVKKQFAKIESRLRQMETHVTSSQFELHREFNKMTRDEPKGAV